MLGLAQVYEDNWRLACCEMCELVLCVFRVCVHSGVVDGLAHDQCLRLNTNRMFGIFHRLPPKVAEFLEKEGIFYVLERTSSPFVEDNLAAEEALGFGWSVVDGLVLVLYTSEIGRLILLLRTSTSVGKTTKRFPSFNRRRLSQTCPGTSLVRTRTLRIPIIEGQTNWSLFLGSLSPPGLRLLDWKMSM